MTKFVAVAKSQHLAQGAALAVEVGGSTVALFRVGDKLHALDDTCSHSGGPLSEGEICDGFAVCPWHGARFALASGKGDGPPAGPDLRVYEVRERDGVIEVGVPE
jgi:nitrite reductase/ring-hydroxylating ferredoxin subunit